MIKKRHQPCNKLWSSSAPKPQTSVSVPLYLKTIGSLKRARDWSHQGKLPGTTLTVSFATSSWVFLPTLLQSKGSVSFLYTLHIYFVFSETLPVALRSRQHRSVILQLNTQVQKLPKSTVGLGFFYLIGFMVWIFCC